MCHLRTTTTHTQPAIIARKILVLNVHSIRNAGDTALLTCVLDIINHINPQSRVTLAMDDLSGDIGACQASISLAGWVKHPNRRGWKLANLLFLIPITIIPILAFRYFGIKLTKFIPPEIRKIIVAIFDADIILSEPGGFLYHSGTGLNLLLSLYTLWLPLLADKPLYFLAQSYGPFAYKWEEYLVRYILNRSRLIFVRETASLKILERLNISPKKIHLVPDLAFSFTGATREQGNAYLEKYGIHINPNELVLGITVLDWGAQNPTFKGQREFEHSVANAASYFLSNYHGKVLLIPQVYGPNVSQDDRIPAKRIANLLEKYHDRVFLISDPPPANILKAIYGLTDVLIGTRMHSNIFALSQYVPVIAIAYQLKTRGIMEMLCLGNWVVDIESVIGRQLEQMLNHLLLERKHIVNHLTATIPKLREQTRTVEKLIAHDFVQYKNTRAGINTPKILEMVYGLDVESKGGGITRFVFSLVQALRGEPLDLKIAALFTDGSPSEVQALTRLKNDGIMVYTLAKTNNNPYRGFRAAFKNLRTTIKDEPVDIIHSHSEFTDILAVLAKLLGYAPKIARTVHYGYHVEWKNRPLRRIFLTYILYPLLFDLEIGVSTAITSGLNNRPLARLLKRKAICIYNAIDTDNWAKQAVNRCEARSALGIVETDILIGSIGRLTEQKGYDVLLKAARKVFEQYPQAYLMIVGTGEDAESLVELARSLSIEKQVIFTGPRSDIPRLLAAMDLFVSSSRWEGLPTVLLESIASRVPIVATNIPGNREVLHNGIGGSLVQSEDPNALAEGILSALADPTQTAKRAAMAFERLQQFSIEQVALKYKYYYLKMVREKQLYGTKE